MGASLLRALGLRAGQERRVLLLMAWCLVVVGGVVIAGGMAGRSLFLSQLPRWAVPFKFVVPPLLLMGAVAVYSRVVDRVRRDRVVVATCAVFAVLVLLLRLGLQTSARSHLSFLSLLYSILEVCGSVAVLQLWTVAGDVFDAREARRAFGLVAAGGVVAATLAGLLLSTLAARVEPADLLWGVLASLAAAALLARELGRLHPDLLTPSGSSDRTLAAVSGAGALAQMRALLAEPLVRSIAGILFASAMVSAVAEFQLDLALQARFGSDGASMVRFLGALQTGAGLAALLLAVALAGRLLERYGVASGLVALPLLLGAGELLILASGGALLASALPRAADGAVKFTLHNSTMNLLYLPVGPTARARMRALLDGVLKPVLVGLLGLLFLAAGLIPGITHVHWALPALFVLIAWGWLVRRAARHYVDALSSSIRQRRLDSREDSLDLADETSREVLAGTLRAEDPALVVHALSILAEAPHPSWRESVTPLLAHPSEPVRVEALRLLSRIGAGEGIGAVEGLLSDPAAAVRAAALQALAATRGLESTEAVLLRLRDEDPQVRAAAVQAALVHCGFDGLLQAGAALKELLESEEPGARVAGARILGEMGARSFHRALLPLLSDVDDGVRRSAVRAAADLRSPELVPALADALSLPSLAAEASRALVRCAADDVGTLLAALQEGYRGRTTRAGLLLVLGRIGSPAARHALEERLAEPDGSLRAAAYQAWRAASPGARVRSELGLAALRREDEDLCRLALLRVDVSAGGSARDELLLDALDSRIAAARERLLLALALEQPELPADALRRSMRAKDKRTRANSLELVENFARSGGRDGFATSLAGDLDSLAAFARERFALRSRPRDDRLTEIAASDDPWLADCARFAQAAPRSRDAMPLTTLEKVLFLKSVPLFHELHGEAIAEITPIAGEQRWPAGETFIRAGDQGDCLYVIVDGQAEVSREGKTLATLGPREVIGELAVLSDKPRTADCVAKSPVLALKIGKQEFWGLLDERPEIATAVLRHVVQRYV
jgi:HEAT repeat protein